MKTHHKTPLLPSSVPKSSSTSTIIHPILDHSAPHDTIPTRPKMAPHPNKNPNQTPKMTSVEKFNLAASATRNELEIKTIIRDAVHEGVKELGTLVNEKESTGECKSEEELRESKLFVALMEEHERLAKVTDEVLKLREKLRKEVEAGERAAGRN
ncbi:hypothetical protein C7212DRAFT_365394 [Tuber magnatum]|uniref:Uncharacterized protein n=1 Tax=Tuber magnatum TaxID=42249 RepID=A0A317SLV8_9PEZI|nr:hypothetical protein C7212DRAFT_365394 [Tuber magnatum]